MPGKQFFLISLPDCCSLFTQPGNCIGNLNYYPKIKLLIGNLLTELINYIEDIGTWVTGVGEEGAVDIKTEFCNGLCYMKEKAEPLRVYAHRLS